MREGLPADAVVMARKPTLVAYYSGRYSIQYVPETDPRAFFRKCEELGVTHFLVDETAPAARALFQRHLDALMSGSAGPWPVVRKSFSLGATHVMELQGSARP
jgi:hypothetical protein